jgi:hypothetical protein
MTDTALGPRGVAVGACRVVGGLAIIVVLGYVYLLRIEAGDGNPFDYFGYFTNQTSLFTSLILIVTGALALAGSGVPAALSLVRGIATAYLLVVAVIYNLLVPGTGSAPPWVSALLHVVFPTLVALDWLFISDRPLLPWRQLWLILPYPILWLIVVLTRGVTDGWVPYGFLLPERGYASLAMHTVGLLAAVIAAGGLVWAASRARGRGQPPVYDSAAISVPAAAQAVDRS